MATQKVELYSAKFYQLCALGGIISCGGSYTL
jgi:hypothetical protein